MPGIWQGLNKEVGSVLKEKWCGLKALRSVDKETEEGGLWVELKQ